MPLEVSEHSMQRVLIPWVTFTVPSWAFKSLRGDKFNRRPVTDSRRVEIRANPLPPVSVPCSALAVLVVPSELPAWPPMSLISRMSFVAILLVLSTPSITGRTVLP